MSPAALTPKLIMAIGLAGLASMALGDGAAESTATPSTKTIMHGIFEPLSQVLPLSLNTAQFTSPTHKSQIETALAKLATQADTLAQHAKGKDASFAYVAESLAKDAHNAHRWYKRGWYNEARFTVHNLTENCLACHSKRQGESFGASGAFFKDINVRSLPPLEQAQLMIVTRRFDEAQETYEKIFSMAQIHPSTMVMMDTFVDYLKLSIRVKQDLGRPRTLIETLRKRQDTPPHVARQLALWSKTLKDFSDQKVLDKTTKPQNALAKARDLIAQGREVMDYPRDRDGLIHYLTASALLQRFLDEHPRQGAGEAYYLLGITETVTGRSFWLSEAEHDLETAIRLEPGASFAPKAYALLEEQLTFGYTGSSGTDIPDDVQKRLDDLRRLISQPRKS